MWIFCCGMQRSGSTLQFQITARLVEESGLGKRLEWVKCEHWPALRDQYADDEGWKVFKNHTCTDEMVSEFHRQNAVGVYVFRDLRDVFVSAMKKYSTPFELLWESGFLEGCLQNFQRWTNLPRVLVSKYEELIMDLPGEVERVATHVGIRFERSKYEQIASQYTIGKQMERIEEAKKGDSLRQGFVNGPYFDPRSNLHTDHINAGTIDGWKDVLSTQQIALIEDKAGDWLVANGYGLSLNSFQRTWNVYRYRAKQGAKAT